MKITSVVATTILATGLTVGLPANASAACKNVDIFTGHCKYPAKTITVTKKNGVELTVGIWQAPWQVRDFKIDFALQKENPRLWGRTVSVFRRFYPGRKNVLVRNLVSYEITRQPNDWIVIVPPPKG